jgi:hypothetical protein
MEITVFENFPEINFMGERYINISNTDFIELKPILDLCRVHNKTLLISFSEKEE